MHLTRASLRQYEDGHCRPEVALVLEFDNGKKLFSIVGYDVYKTQLARFNNSADDVLEACVQISHATMGTPSQPVFYSLDDVIPEDGDHYAAIGLANLKTEFIELAVKVVE